MSEPLSTRTRLLLVDDQRLFVDSLRVVIETWAPDLDVVGIAGDGREALSMVEEHKPDLVIMDVRMPDLDGVAAVKELRSRDPSIRVLMLTTFDDDEYVYQAIHHGAVGYLLKDMSAPELLGAIRAATTGSIQISPSVASKLVDRAHRSEDQQPPAPDSATAPRSLAAPRTVATPRGEELTLTRRDEEVLHLVAQGLDNHEIGAELHLAEQTVKNRISDLYDRLDVHDRLHLIRRARELGFGDTRASAAQAAADPADTADRTIPE